MVLALLDRRILTLPWEAGMERILTLRSRGLDLLFSRRRLFRVLSDECEPVSEWPATVRVMPYRVRIRLTAPLPLACAAKKWACGHQWDRLAIVTTTPCVRASLPRWNANCWIAGSSKPRLRHVLHALSLLKAGTIPLAVIRLWGISHQSTTKGDKR